MNCQDCNKEIKNRKAKRCISCAGISRRGVPKSDKVKKAVSLAQKGKKHKPQQGWQKGHGLLGNNPTSKGKNWKLSDETKTKQGLAKIGAKSYNFGKTLPIETRRKIAEAQKGEKSHFWRGGITIENHKIRCGIEFRLWREAVFARDNWTCQKYGEKGVKLHPHHIQNFSQFPELRFAIDNGITLSEKAHKEFHKQYGFKNNTRAQLEEFLNN